MPLLISAIGFAFLGEFGELLFMEQYKKSPQVILSRLFSLTELKRNGKAVYTFPSH
jgi:hypothetical protein